ncbi:MAG: hypothetical protein ACYTBJ_09535 [Planctomycetota bacterium]|jgi:hypothetical protein
MKLPKRKPSGREKDEASIELLEKLRQQLYSDDSSVRRCAAYNLSWMQEDGLDILKEALFGDFPRFVKHAAAYGIRSMRGRMKKKAREVFEQGQSRRDRDTRQICKNELLPKEAKAARKANKHKKVRVQIREIPARGRQKRRSKRRHQRNTDSPSHERP